MLISHLTRLDKNSRNALYAALLIIVAVGMYGWIVSPHVKYLQAVQKYHPAVEKIIDKQQDIKKMLVSRRTLLMRLKAEFDEVGSTIFSAEQVQQLFGELGTVAEQYGCSLAQIDLSSEDPEIIVGAAADPTYVQSIKAGLTLLGDYGPLLGFVNCLQNQDRKIWINSIDIERLEDETGQEKDGELKCDISLEIFVIQKKEVASDE